MTTIIQNKNDLLSYLITQADSGNKNWFGFSQQKVVGIYLSYAIAERHADTMTAEEITDFVKRLNNSIHDHLILGKNGYNHS